MTLTLRVSTCIKRTAEPSGKTYNSARPNRTTEMKSLIALFGLLVAAAAEPSQLIAPLAYGAHFYAQPFYSPLFTTAKGFAYSSLAAHQEPLLTYRTAPLAYSAPLLKTTPIVTPLVHQVAALEKSQYHTQDELGQASYGHAEAFQKHDAIQDIAGNKIGSYSYVAPDGQLISADYVADALGYRVTSNASPVNAAPVAPSDTAEVVSAREAHLKAHEEVKQRTRRSLAYTYDATPLTYSATHLSHPVTYTAAATSTYPVHYTYPYAYYYR